MRKLLILCSFCCLALPVFSQSAKEGRDTTDMQFKKNLYCVLDGVPKTFDYLYDLFGSPAKSNLEGLLWLGTRDNIKTYGERARNGIWIVRTINKIEKDSLNPGEFGLYGTAPITCEGDRVTLLTFQSDHPDKIFKTDTTVVSNGKFYFTGPQNDYLLSVVTIGNYPEKVLSADVILEEGRINLQLDTISHRGGTPLNDTLQCYYSINKPTFATIEVYARRHANDALGRTLLVDRLLNNWGLDELKAFAELTDEKFREIPQLKEAIANREKEQEVLNTWEMLRNKPYMDEIFIGLNGENVQLSSLVKKNKLLFIDVWYSGCGPCIAEMPRLKELYEHYKDKGLEVIAVSTDISAKAWKEAVKNVNMPWRQFLLDKHSDFTKNYAVLGVPHGILIGEDGKIIDIGYHLRPSIPILNELIKKRL